MVFNNLYEAKDFYRQYRDIEDGEYNPKVNGYYQSHAVHLYQLKIKENIY